MPASPVMRFSPGRERRADTHKRGRSLESGIVFKERDDDLALFNEVQSTERDDFLLQSNDDFEDTFATKLRHFSDHKLGINIASRGESNDLLNTEEEKNDYEWLITPPDTPLFPSLDDETPQVILAQRGRPRAQPMSISRSSTMEKSHRSSRGSASPNRLSPSPRSRNLTFQPRGRASSTPSSSPPPSLRSTTGSRRPSSPSGISPAPAPRTSTPTSRRLSTGSITTTSPGAMGNLPVNKTSRGNSVSPKVKAWQANIPGFSTEVPPNLRTSLADRPASYVRGSSPASRNGRQSKSPTASRSISSSRSHDRERFRSHSKGSIASSADDDVESLPSITVDGSERSNSRKVSGFRNNKAPLSQKPSKTISSSSAPKRSFDLALRQMDHKRGPQNMFRPLLSSVPSTTFSAGKTSPAWNSSVTTSSNASSDIGTSGTHDVDEAELNQDDAISGYIKVPDCNVDDEVFVFEKTDCLNEDMGNGTHDASPVVQIDGLKDHTLHSQPDGFENLAELDTATSIVSEDFSQVNRDMLLCSRCGCKYLVIRPIEEDNKLCANCQKSDSSMTINNIVTSEVAIGSSQAKPVMSDEDLESLNASNPRMTLVESESPEMASTIEARPEQHQDLVIDGEVIHTEPILNVINDTNVSCSDSGIEKTPHAIDVPNSKADPFEGEGISIVLKRSSSIRGPFNRSGTFSASSISFDDFSYVRDSTNSMRSSVGRGSMSASSSIDFGPAMQADTRFQRQWSSRKSDTNAKHQRSASSFSATSSHAFHPSSVGTSTHDSFDVVIPSGGADVADVTSVGLQETPGENKNSTENEDVNKVQVDIAAASELPIAHDSGEVLLPESSDFEEPVSIQKVENVGKDNALTICTVDEDTSLDSCVKSTDVEELQLGAISEGELDRTCSFSPVSECNASLHSDSSIEELQNPDVLTALDKDIAASAADCETSDHPSTSAADCETSNHPSSIVEESMVLVEGQGGTKGRSLTLEEATETILFCSSIVHNLAYEAASIAIEKEPHPDPSKPDPLVPSIGKSYSNKKELQNRKSTKRSTKAQKARQRKATENDNAKAPNTTKTSEVTESPKPRIVFPNNKENTKPPKVLESKCNCRIM